MNKNKNNVKKNKDNEDKNKDKQKKPKVILKPTDVIGYHQVDVLSSFMTEQSKIKPRRLTRLTLKQQRQLAKGVKRARILTLIPYVKTTEN